MRRVHWRWLVTALVGVLTSSPAVFGGVTPQTIATNVERAWVISDRLGTSHLAYVTAVAGESTLYYASASLGALRFSAPRAIPVAATGTDFAGPFILQEPTPSSRLVILTQRCCKAGQPELHAVASLDGGRTWSASQAVSEAGISVNPTGGPVSLVAVSATAIYAVNGIRHSA